MKKYLQQWATGMLVALMIVLLGTADALAQDRTVSGSVKSSDDGEALPGVSVMVKGTTMGTVTDGDGVFQLSVPEGAVLVVSFVGFKTQEYEVVTRTQIEVTLEVDVTNL